MTKVMSGMTRYKGRYKRASTDLYRWGEPDRDVYVRKWQYVRKRECISNTWKSQKCIIPRADDKKPESAGQAGGKRAETVDIGGDERTEDSDS